MVRPAVVDRPGFGGKADVLFRASLPSTLLDSGRPFFGVLFEGAGNLLTVFLFIYIYFYFIFLFFRLNYLLSMVLSFLSFLLVELIVDFYVIFSLLLLRLRLFVFVIGFFAGLLDSFSAPHRPQSWGCRAVSLPSL